MGYFGKGMLVLGLLLAAAGGARADFVNGGFEDGNLNGWTAIGDVSVQVTIFGIAPFGGSNQALLTTIDDQVAGDGPAYSGTPAGAIFAIEGDLNVTLPTHPSNGNSPTEGSSLRQNFTGLSAGDQISFRWNYLTNDTTPDPNAEDYAFAFLIDTTNNTLVTSFLLTAADADTAATQDANGNFLMQTGYLAGGFTIVSAGNYMVAVGVVDTEDTVVNSGLLVDNFVLTPSLVPEPASIAMLSVTALGAAGYGWRRRKQQAAKPQAA